MDLIDQHADLLATAFDDVRRIALQLDTLIQHADTPVWELTLDGHITDLNPAAVEWFGDERSAARGRAFTDYVADSASTQRHLDHLAQSSTPQIWSERLLNSTQPPHDCQLAARRIERPETGTRLLLWLHTPTPDDPFELADDRCLADERPVCGADLERIRERLGLSVQRTYELLGVTATTWYAWRKATDTPIGNRTAELHLRLLDALPELAQPGGHPSELKQVLAMRFGIQATGADLAAWLGAQRRAGYVWADKGPVNGQARALTRSLLRMLLEYPPQMWRFYLNIVENQARVENAHSKADA